MYVRSIAAAVSWRGGVPVQDRLPAPVRASGSERRPTVRLQKAGDWSIRLAGRRGQPMLMIAVLCHDQQYRLNRHPQVEVVTMPTTSRQYVHIVHRASAPCLDHTTSILAAPRPALPRA